MLRQLESEPTSETLRVSCELCGKVGRPEAGEKASFGHSSEEMEPASSDQDPPVRREPRRVKTLLRLGKPWEEEEDADSRLSEEHEPARADLQAQP